MGPDTDTTKQDANFDPSVTGKQTPCIVSSQYY